MTTKKDYVDTYFDHGLHLSTRTLYLGAVQQGELGELGVDFLLAEYAIKGLHLLDQTEGPIKIQLNNFGGDEYHGAAIYDAIAACKSFVEIVVYGSAMSMAVFILQAGDRRVLMPNARLMIHYGTWAFEGHSKDAIGSAREAEFWNDRYEQVLYNSIRTKQPGYKRYGLKRLLRFDSYMSAPDAVKLGLADEVYDAS